MHLRPYPLHENQDTFISTLGKQLNSHNLQAGSGIKITSHNNHHLIEAQSTRLQDGMTYKGEFNPNAEYFVDDVVYVDGTHNYVDSTFGYLPCDSQMTSGSSYTRYPYLAAGLYICSTYIPPYDLDSTILTTVVAPSMATYGGQVTGDFADMYRHNSLNVYYPIYPTIPSNYTTRSVESTWDTQTNQTFWTPLVPYIALQTCVNNTTVVTLVAGYTSGLTFDASKLPHTASI